MHQEYILKVYHNVKNGTKKTLTTSGIIFLKPLSILAPKYAAKTIGITLEE